MQELVLALVQWTPASIMPELQLREPQQCSQSLTASLNTDMLIDDDVHEEASAADAGARNNVIDDTVLDDISELS